MRTTFIILVALCVVPCLQVEAKAIDVVKKIVDAGADVADKTTEVEQTGGFRQTVMHKIVGEGLDKGLDALSKTHPVMKLAAPTIKKLAKPLVNKAHEKINNMFDKDDSEKEDAKVEEAKKEEAKKEEAKEEEAKKEEPKKEEAKKEEAKKEEADQKEADQKDGEKKQEGLMGKLTSLVKGEKSDEAKPEETKDKSEAEKSPQDSAEGSKSDEKTDKKKEN